MKKSGILNDRISALIARMGHKESLMICDAGMPIPPACNRIDLALSPGIPSFLQVLDAVLGELCVEGGVLAEEISSHNGTLEGEIRRMLGDLPLDYVPHTEMKEAMPRCKGIIRTGEFSPFANLRLVSGVVF